MSLLNQKIKDEIKNILDNHGVLAFPTDTVWGLGCNPLDEIAVKKIYELKKRDVKKPLILMSSSVKYLKPFVKGFNVEEEEIIKKYFPGALTIITEKSDKTPYYMTSDFDTVGIRVPNHPVFAEIADLSSCKVLATTSANLSTQPSSLKKDDVIKYFGDSLIFVTDDFGYFAENKESTIIKYNDGWHVLRQGVIEIG